MAVSVLFVSDKHRGTAKQKKPLGGGFYVVSKQGRASRLDMRAVLAALRRNIPWE